MTNKRVVSRPVYLLLDLIVTIVVTLSFELFMQYSTNFDMFEDSNILFVVGVVLFTAPLTDKIVSRYFTRREKQQ